MNPSVPRTIRVASRPSRLALIQTREAISRLAQFLPGYDFRVIRIPSEGDRRQSTPLREFGDKAVFVVAVEQALVDGRADLAVHSLKDVPIDHPPGLWMPAFLEREDPRDVLISRTGCALAELPAGSRVGTGSLRRIEQLSRVRPDLAYVDIRGNVDTRLAKVAAGEYEGTVLAAAGILRLGLSDRIAEFLDPEVCVPAPGQGIVAVECRENYELGEELLAAGDASSQSSARIERGLAREMGATCATPFGALATPAGATLTVRAFLAHDGSPGRHGFVRGDTGAPEKLIASIAAQLRTAE